MPATTKPRRSRTVDCPFCGRTVSKNDIITCPRCGREGCCTEHGGCMPAGNNCMCPECEEGNDDIDDLE